MLVGGEPINADPPLRCVDLLYAPPGGGDAPGDWASAVTLSLRDFGPLLHTPSVSLVSKLSRGLYCEHFVSAALKWKICTKDFRDIVKVHELSKQQRERQSGNRDQDGRNVPRADPSSPGDAASLSDEAYNGLLEGVQPEAGAKGGGGQEDVQSASKGTGYRQ